MIDRRRIMTGMAGIGTTMSLPALAQKSTGAPVVGFVALARRDPSQVEALKLGLREHGLEPGRSVQVEERFGDGDPVAIHHSIAQLVSAGVRVFVAGGPNVVRMIQQQSPDAAIVVASLESLDTAGVQGTIARPLGHVTGFATLAPELLSKRLELAREIMPSLRQVALAVNPNNRNHPALLAAAVQAGGSLKIKVDAAGIASVDQLQAALSRARADGAQAIIFPRDYMFESIRPEIVKAALESRIASIFDESDFVRQGGLLSYSPNRPDLFRRSADYVVKILAGAKPADLPVQLPTKFELAVNLQTAKSLGLAIPPSILLRADEVIE